MRIDVLNGQGRINTNASRVGSSDFDQMQFLGIAITKAQKERKAAEKAAKQARKDAIAQAKVDKIMAKGQAISEGKGAGQSFAAQSGEIAKGLASVASAFVPGSKGGGGFGAMTKGLLPPGIVQDPVTGELVEESFLKKNAVPIGIGAALLLVTGIAVSMRPKKKTRKRRR